MELMEVHEEADMLTSIAAPHARSSTLEVDDDLSQLAPRAEVSVQVRHDEAADTDTIIIENKVRF